MRRVIIAVAAVAVTVAGCATVNDAIPPKGVAGKQEAADRAHCRQVGEAARRDPRMKAHVEEGIKAQMLGTFLGGGLIGLAVAATQQDKMRIAWEKNWVNKNNWECLKRKGYTLPGQS
jgi:hypothetical protein